MSSINQRLFLVSLILVLVAMMGWRLMFDLDGLTASVSAPGAVRSIQERFAWSIAAVLSVVILLMVYLNQTISKPIQRLIDEIDRSLALGVPARLEVRGQDELATLSSRFNILQDRLARRIRELEQFAGNVCHEIRTPLTSILSAAELMSDLDEPLVALIRTEAERIHNLSRIILNYSSSVKSGHPPQQMRADLAVILRDLLEVPAYAHRVKLLEPVSSQIVHTDAEVLTQALSIIVDNALRYTPADATVSVQLLGGQQPTILIRNEGPHIPEVFLERIFERFFSLSVDGCEKGTGIGLALCRDLVEALGGRVEAMNLAPRGVLFSVSLPVASERV